MTDICKRCNHKYFAFEYKQNKEFSNWCHQGKVKLPENPSSPNQFKLLATGISEGSTSIPRILIWLYNNALAFASFGAKFDKIFSSGPQVIRICG